MVRGPGVSDANVVVAFHRSKVSGWTVNVLRPAAGVYAPMRQTATAVGLALLVALAIAVASRSRGRASWRAAYTSCTTPWSGCAGLHRRSPSEEARFARSTLPWPPRATLPRCYNVRSERLPACPTRSALGLRDWDFRDGSNGMVGRLLYATDRACPAGAGYDQRPTNSARIHTCRSRTRVNQASNGSSPAAATFARNFASAEPTGRSAGLPASGAWIKAPAAPQLGCRASTSTSPTESMPRSCCAKARSISAPSRTPRRRSYGWPPARATSCS